MYDFDLWEKPIDQLRGSLVNKMSEDQWKPKVILFDIGGVCVVSPMKAIIEYEKANGIPIGYINYAISATKPNGSWHRAERGEVALDDAWFAGFKSDIERTSTWESYHQRKLKEKFDKSRMSPPPQIDAAELFWTMMSTARTPDPFMAPALRKLQSNKESIHIAALSNTTIFPEGHPYNEPGPDDVRTYFETFISSAHVGMRKPDRNIYEYAMKAIREKWPEDDIKPEDVLFLDDIGENLRMGKSMGWKTLKVLLGKTDLAVRELERVTGLQLLVAEKSGSKL